MAVHANPLSEQHRALLNAVWIGETLGVTIVATARIHGLKLITSDQRIIESRLVPVID